MLASPSVLLTGPDPAAKRDEIRRCFHHTFDTDERLFDLLADEAAFYRRADPLRHPLVFYFGHTACFFINKLVSAGALDQRLEPTYESLFAIGVDEMSWDDLDETHYDWPPIAAVRAYRDRVRETVDACIAALPLTLPITWNSPFWAVLMGIEHARIHLETSSVLIRQLPLELVRPHPDWPVCPDRVEPPDNVLVPVSAGPVRLGKAADDRLYGWDNEYGELHHAVPAFAAARDLVSNRAFHAFVTNGGYTRREWWTDEGWAWCSWDGTGHPRFWRRGSNGSWRLRCVAEEIPMPWNWPVEVNQLEAAAYCRWLAQRNGRALRLPGEEEYRRLRAVAGVRDKPERDRDAANIDLAHWASSCPVDHFRHGAFHDVIGNVWQHTATPIHPFPGFRVHPIYDDFSTPTFDDRHNLIVGGSWIATGNEATHDARYAFRRHFYQHAGFRYIAAEHPPARPAEPRIEEADVCRDCHDQWGAQDTYHQRLAELCAQHQPGGTAALHLDCGTGRLVCELAGRYDRCLGLARSARFLRVPDRLRAHGAVAYALPQTGDLTTHCELRRDDHACCRHLERCEFLQDDPANLKSQRGRFDLVVVTELLDAMADPRQLLDRLGELVASGGMLVLASAWQWDPTITPRERWLGGIKDATGENRVATASLAALLADAFTPCAEPVTLQRHRRFDANRTTVLREQACVFRRR
ncbi:MAG: 5-histidylcysteine sulfoxide synthase [Planctomycetota bacterium]